MKLHGHLGSSLLALLLGACGANRPAMPPTEHAPTPSQRPSSASTPVAPTSDTRPAAVALTETKAYLEPPTLTPEPTRPVGWEVPVLDLGTRLQGFDFGWLNESQLRLGRSRDDLGDFEIIATFSEGERPSFVIDTIRLDHRVFSPRRAYYYDCIDEIPALHRAETGEWIHQAPGESIEAMPGRGCPIGAVWAPDETAVALIGADQTAYLWSTAEAAPRSLGHKAASFTAPAWSPDASRLAIVLRLVQNQTAVVGLFDLEGQLTTTLTVNQGASGTTIQWFSPDILLSWSRYSQWYYDVDDGQYLFERFSAPEGDGVYHQIVTLSPDQRWAFLDQTSAEYANSSSNRGSKIYRLYDLQTRQDIVLSTRPQFFLKLTGWSADSRSLYLVARQGTPVSHTADGLPVGLLALDPLTLQVDALIGDAIDVNWSADMDWAFVIAADPERSTPLAFVGRFWQRSTGAQVGAWELTDPSYSADPAYASWPSEHVLRHVWSHNGMRLALADGLGNLWLASPAGEAVLLTSQMPRENLQLLWSPDDRYLAVHSGIGDWVVPLPIE